MPEGFIKNRSGHDMWLSRLRTEHLKGFSVLC